MRSRAVFCFGLLAALAMTGLARGQEPAGALRLVDDRGEAVAGLTVCFQIELAMRCVEAGSGEVVPLPPSFASLRVEGPHHGPVSARRGSLRPEGEGEPAVLRVPRKAFLEIDWLPSDPLTVAIFRARAPSFRDPVFRGVAGPAGVEIPSGELVAALESRGHAPDLQRLVAPPGGRVKLAYRPQEGWSLAVRCREAAGGKLVERAAVSVRGQTEETGADGLALLSGLPQETVRLEVSHPRYLPQEVDGLAAEPGALAFREIGFDRGGTVRARITMDGRAAGGTPCAVLDQDPGARVRGAVRGDGTTGSDGVCRTGRLAAGSYILRVSIPEGRSFIDQAVSVREGEDSEVLVLLASIHVSGRVFQAGRPAVGFRVEAAPVGAWTSGLSPLRAITNAEGEYQGTLWSPGEYLFRLTAGSGTPVVGERRVDLSRPEESVDFELDPKP